MGRVKCLSFEKRMPSSGLLRELPAMPCGRIAETLAYDRCIVTNGFLSTARVLGAFLRLTIRVWAVCPRIALLVTGVTTLTGS